MLHWVRNLGGYNISILHDYEVVKEAVEKSQSLSQVLDELGLSKSGDCYNHVRKYCKQYNIDLPIYNNKRGGKLTLTPLSEMLVENKNIQGSKLAKRLIKEKLIKNICNICGHGPEWMGKPLTLQLDHINGNNQDNRIENLRILCPHCHSQTENWGGRNKRTHSKNFCNCGKQIGKTSTYCRGCVPSKTYSRYLQSSGSK